MLSHSAASPSHGSHDFYAVLPADLRAHCDVEVHQRDPFENKERYVVIHTGIYAFNSLPRGVK
jgi:hypothetical protein